MLSLQWKVGNTNSSFSALMYSMMMPLALAFLSASFLVFPLHERETKAKQVGPIRFYPVNSVATTHTHTLLPSFMRPLYNHLAICLSYYNEQT